MTEQTPADLAPGAGQATPATEAPQTTPEQSEDEAYSAAFDRATVGDAATDEPQEQHAGGDNDEAAEQPEADPNAEAAPEPAPKHLPHEVKQAWAQLTPEAREAVSRSHLELTQKLAHQGREAAALRPIRDTLQQAIEKIPGIAEMTPGQLSQELMQMAEITSQFQTRPLETMMGLIQRHGLEQHVAQALMGQQPQGDPRLVNDLKREISTLKQQLQGAADPNRMRQQWETWQTESRMVSSVDEFARTAEHWSEVEDMLPATIQYLAQTGFQGSPEDTLKAAYEMAVRQRVPNAQAQAEDAEASTTADPKRAQAVAKAKSVNVQGKRSGRAREMTEEEAMAARYDEIMSRAS